MRFISKKSTTTDIFNYFHDELKEEIEPYWFDKFVEISQIERSVCRDCYWHNTEIPNDAVANARLIEYVSTIRTLKKTVNKYGFRYKESDDIKTVLAKNTDGKWVEWFYIKDNHLVLIGNTDHLNIWLYKTTDLSVEAIVDFALEVGAITIRDTDEYIPLRAMVDPEDWQEIANVPDAYEDVIYTTAGDIFESSENDTKFTKTVSPFGSFENEELNKWYQLYAQMYYDFVDASMAHFYNRNIGERPIENCNTLEESIKAYKDEIIHIYSCTVGKEYPRNRLINMYHILEELLKERGI